MPIVLVIGLVPIVLVIGLLCLGQLLEILKQRQVAHRHLIFVDNYFKLLKEMNTKETILLNRCGMWSFQLLQDLSKIFCSVISASNPISAL
jgi:hypothetical protein